MTNNWTEQKKKKIEIIEVDNLLMLLKTKILIQIFTQ